MTELTKALGFKLILHLECIVYFFSFHSKEMNDNKSSHSFYSSLNSVYDGNVNWAATGVHKDEHLFYPSSSKIVDMQLLVMHLLY